MQCDLRKPVAVRCDEKWARCTLLVLITSCSVFATAAGLLHAADTPPTTQPNILLIMTDDQGWGDFRAHGNAQIDTPNFDQLVRDGAEFERFYVSPVCAPTRASLMTGRYHLRTGVSGVTHGYEVMRADEETIAEALRAGGYRTACIGKWHNGENFPHSPLGQGFDEFFGFLGGITNVYFDTELVHNGRRVRTSGYITDTLTDAALSFINSPSGDASRPFFCYLAYNAPHTPCAVGDQFYAKYRGRGFAPRTAAIYGMCESIDRNLGRLLEAVDDPVAARPTVVLFLTDNGPNGSRYNGGMRGTKASVHEGGVRVPLVVRWPGTIRAGLRINELAAHIDVFPTLLEIAGVRRRGTKPLDGRSLLPLLREQVVDWSDRVLLECYTGGRPLSAARSAVRTDRYRLVKFGRRNAPQPAMWELYDLKTDPGQQTEISARQPDVVQQLAARHDAFVASIDRARLAPPPTDVGHPEQPAVTLFAPLSRFQPPLRFANGAGYTSDWLVNWTDPNAAVQWEVNVVRSGRYEIILEFACGKQSVGTELRVDCGDATLHAALTTYLEPAPYRRPDRDPDADRLLQRFTEQSLGELQIEAGRHIVALSTSRPMASEICEVKSITLRRRP